MIPNRRCVDVNLDELDRVLDGARETPLSEADCEKVKTALHALAAMLVRPRNTEKTNAVLPKSEDPGKDAGPRPDESSTPPAKGHGRNGADAFSGAQKIDIKHQNLKHGDRCPDCGQGNVYGQKEPKVLVRVVGQAPLAATVYSLERLRCGACGQVFTAQEPEGVGPERYDETATAMVAQLKYGSGVPFNRLEQLEAHLGIPLPATTQWEMVEEGAELIKPARDELIRHAAQDEVFHNDDTGMKVLKMNREPGDKRTGTFTSGIVSTTGQRKIALYFTGRQHAGENLADVLRQRASDLGPPIQMCDALSWNTSKLSEGVEVMIAHCLAHGRRQIVDVAENFPGECRYVLEQLGEVYHIDAVARKTGLSPQERLQFHQEHSKPIMEGLHKWLEAQLAEHKTEPNSGLGQAIRYLLRHWQPLTLFLRQAGAPLDNNLVTAVSGSDDVMPIPRLCRVDLLAYAIREGSRIFTGAVIGIITSSPGKRVRRLEAGSGQARASMGWHAPALAP